jgi:predicted transcriptional regulator
MTSVKRRSRLQLQIAVLEACDWRDGLPLTRVAQKAFVNVQDCKEMLEFFVKKNYVQKTLYGKRFLFKLTNAGREFVFQVALMQKNLDSL